MAVYTVLFTPSTRRRRGSQDPDKLRQFALERLSALPELFSADVPRARAELARHVTHITMMASEAKGSQHYVCQGDWNPIERGTFGWLRGVDLNHRPLGYECKEECHFNESRGQGGASKY